MIAIVEEPNETITCIQESVPERELEKSERQEVVRKVVSKVPDLSTSVAAQDILRCDFCQEDDVVGELYCKTCTMHLCSDCVSKHIGTSTISCFHDIAKYKSSKDFIRPICEAHADEKCEIFCKECNIPFCSQCLSEGSHKHHDITGICGTYAMLKDKIMKDTKYLEENMVPEFEKNIGQMTNWLAETMEQYDIVAATMCKIESEWYKQLENAVLYHKNEIHTSREKDVGKLSRCQESLTGPLMKIRGVIQENRHILNSLDFVQLFEYRSSVESFRRVPPLTEITAPKFEQHTTLLNQLVELIGKLGSTKIITIPGYTIRTHMPEPILITKIPSKYKKGIRRLRCQSNNKVWVCGFFDRLLKCFDLKGSVVHRVITKHPPVSMTLNKNGEIIWLEDYCVNIIKDGESECLFKVGDWKLRSVCTTVNDELLVGMNNAQKTEGKVVRYSGLKIIQEIQKDSEGNLLFCMPYFVHENKNLDICVTEVKLQKVLVTDKTGSLRFAYSGNKAAKKTFKPMDLATDSKSQILIADRVNNCIHIIDKDGGFIKIIDCFDLVEPFSICVSSEDNLCVAEGKSGVIKVIQYMKD